jgi:hypothetical protein
MSRRYNNFKKKIQLQNMCIITTEDEFIRDRIISFKCSQDHISLLNEFSFNNKTNPKNFSKIKSLCADCNYLLEKEEEAKSILSPLNFKFIKVEKDIQNFIAIVHYQCKCGNISKTSMNNLKRETKTDKCMKCLNDDNKVSYEYLQKIFEEKGCLLLTKPGEYVNNKTLLNFQCICGEISGILLNDIKRGRLCIHCKGERFKKTLMEKYGVENVFHCPEIFRKYLSSCFKRKQYISPVGKEYFLLGYEERVLDILFKELPLETIIYAGEDKEVPCFDYIGFDDKKHKYYPDIFIPSQNKIIEVKSDYTYNYNPLSNLAKALSVSETHVYEIWVLDEKRVLEILECNNGIFCSRVGGNLIMGEIYDKKKNILKMNF